MASLPAETTLDDLPAEAAAPMVPSMASDSMVSSGQMPGNDLLDGFSGLPILRQVGLMVGLAASVAIGFAVVLWSQQPDSQVLYSRLDAVDMEQVVDVLISNDIEHQVDYRTMAVLVSADDIHKARMKLAGSDLLSDKTLGYELLDQETSLGTSQFMEATRYRRALEGELARTIASLASIKSARVHLAIPKESVFVRDLRRPSASVFINLGGSRRLQQEQIRSIVNLVATSIAEMHRGDVTVVDQHGNLLSGQEEDKNLLLAAKQLEYSRRIESDLNRRIGSILDPIVGGAGFKAEVSADVDFTWVEETAEQYNPDLLALRSEQVLDESRNGGGFDGGIPGALSNQPPGEASVPEQVGADGEAVAASSSRSRKQATRNYELDRSLSHTRHQQGRIRRLSVAVVVDDMLTTNAASGEVEYTPWGDAELQRLSILVKDAVGYDAVRGDSLNVINTPFLARGDEVIAEPSIWQQSWFQTLLKQLMGLVFLLALVFGVLRPIMRTLAGPSDAEKALADEEEQSLNELEALEEEEEDIVDDTVTLSGGESNDYLLASPSESYEQQLEAVRGLIAEDPGRVALVIKEWIASDA